MLNRVTILEKKKTYKRPDYINAEKFISMVENLLNKGFQLKEESYPILAGFQSDYIIGNLVFEYPTTVYGKKVIKIGGKNHYPIADDSNKIIDYFDDFNRKK